MSSDLLKTITVSLTSSFCTALFVVACTAGADSKTDHTASDASGSDGVDDPGDGGDDPGDGGDDPGDGGDGVDAATLADLELRIADLELEVRELKDNTFRWETFEVECPDGTDEDFEIDVGADAVSAIVYWTTNHNPDKWSRSSTSIDADNFIEKDCRSHHNYDGQRAIYRVAYDW
jgi:hypothetical protein